MKVEITTTKGRHFSGAVGLKAGYGEDGRKFPHSLIHETWKSWVASRRKEGKPFLGIIISQEETIAYAFEKEGELAFYDEPVVCVRGEIASYQEHLSDEEVCETLTSLFSALGAATEQTTVRFTYWGDEGYRKSFRVRLPNTSHPLD